MAISGIAVVDMKVAETKGSRVEVDWIGIVKVGKIVKEGVGVEGSGIVSLIVQVERRPAEKTSNNKARYQLILFMISIEVRIDI